MNAPQQESPSRPADTSTGRHFDVEGLLALAVSRPRDAQRAAATILAAGGTAREASIAHHALAIVERDRGRLPLALTHARQALRLGPSAGPGREAEVRATVGTTYLFGGQTAKALRELDRAVVVAEGEAEARVLYLRGGALALVGRYDDALRDLARSVRLSRRRGDDLWQARALTGTGEVLRSMGRDDAAGRAYREAEEILGAVGHDLEVANAVHNRAVASAQRGDLVEGLAVMERAREAYRALGAEPAAWLVVDYAMTLVSARLTSEARAAVDDALARPDTPSVWRAELLLVSARIALLEADWALAADCAGQAGELFRSHRRATWTARARLLAIEATYAPYRATTDGGEDGGVRGDAELERLYGDCGRLVRRLRARGDPSMAEALLLFAQIAEACGHGRSSRRTLAGASRVRAGAPPLTRAAGWLAGALLAAAEGDRRALARCCRRGLDAVDEHRRVIGDLELRALASGYGQELTTLAARDALARGDSRRLLWWVERWRSTALVAPPGRPDDPALARDIAALRDVSRRLTYAAPSGPSADDGFLRRERSRLETEVRARYRHLRATGAVPDGPDLASLLGGLGSTVLVYLVLLDGTLHAVTVAGGRATVREVGSHQEAMRQVELARFTLRRAAHGRPVDLRAAGAALQRAVLGSDLPSAWSAESVLVVPAASLLTVPWGLLPVFADGSLTVAPSLTLWHRARGEATASGRPGHVALVTGPELSTREAEIVDLAGIHTEATVVEGAAATVEATLAALDGASLAHIAAHGSFRADAPLFSSLLLADGPLMIHDLDRLSIPPRAVVLSACDSGGLQAIGADEALGLVSSLLALGTSGVVASVCPVNDVATMSVMASLHRAVASGASLADGLRAARREARGDALVAATAASFNAWGA